jgi:hypothetical protein
MLTRFVISRLGFNGPDVELSEAASTTTVVIPHSTWPSSLGEMARRMLIPIHATGIHADKLSIAKKRESLSQEKAVISVRDKKLIVQRAQGDPEALKLLFESCRGQLFACALRILPRRQDAEDAVQGCHAGSVYAFERVSRSGFLDLGHEYRHQCRHDANSKSAIEARYLLGPSER